MKLPETFSKNTGARGDASGAKSNDIVNDHLEKGKQLLATGQLSDALSHFHAAIGRRGLKKKILNECFFEEADPQNYQAYFRRATVYLAMGKSKSALPDLSQVIKLKPDFIAVRFCRKQKTVSLFGGLSRLVCNAGMSC